MSSNKKLKHILFLGAGASMDLGYPQTDNLLSVTKKHAFDIKIRPEYIKAFSFVDEIRNKEHVPRYYQNLFDEKTPEVYFTITDILSKVYQKSSERHFEGLTSYWQNNQLTEEIIQQSEDQYSLPEIEKIKSNIAIIKDGIENYFFYELWKDTEEHTYILNMLKNKDLVISTNWDAVIEKILYKEKQWFPSDGYGFQCDIRDFWMKPQKNKSKIKVLKLNGSIGWRIQEKEDVLSNNKITLANEFLHWLTGVLTDKNYKYSATNVPYMQFPTFAKELAHPELINIWSTALNAISRCNELTVVGYSLPDSDTTIRVLFLPIIERLKKHQIKLTIVVGEGKGGEETKERWKNFLNYTEEDIFILKNAKNYFDC